MHKCIACSNTVQDAGKFYCASCWEMQHCVAFNTGCTNTFQDASKFYCPTCCGAANPTVTLVDWVQIVGREYTKNMTPEKQAEFRALDPEQRTVFMNSLLERVRAAHPGHSINLEIDAVNFKFGDSEKGI